jgi:death-on-curing protein
MTEYITLDEALRIHEVLIEVFGGASGVRDMGLLETALLRPQTGYYGDLVEEAAALWESLAMNHPFVDGSKRVAYAVVELLLQTNGIDIVADNQSIDAFIYSNLEAGTFRKDVIEPWLRANTGPYEG